MEHLKKKLNNLLNQAIELDTYLLNTMPKSILQEAIQGKLVSQIPEEGTAEQLLDEIRKEKTKLVKEGKLKKSALTESVIFRGDDNKYYERKGKSVVEISDDMPFEIPESWAWCRVPQIAISDLGKTLDKAKNTGISVKYLCSINVYWDGIDLSAVKEALFTESEREKYLLRKGDLLICEGGDIGRSAIWNDNQEMYYQNALHRLRFYRGVSAEYFLQVLSLYKSMGILDSKSKGVTIKHFTQNALYTLLIPLPPKEEQIRIVEATKRLFQVLK